MASSPADDDGVTQAWLERVAGDPFTLVVVLWDVNVEAHWECWAPGAAAAAASAAAD